MNNRRHQLRQSLDLRLTQRLALTPSLLQKIQLLQLNKLELTEMLNQELIENPILEEVLDADAPRESSLEEKAGIDVQTSDDVPAETERDSFDEVDFRYLFDEYLDTGYKNREVEDLDRPSFETFLVGATSLADHLMFQLGVAETDNRIAAIAEQIIGNLNQDGYLVIDLEELCQLAECTVAEAEEALALVQCFDPTGVGARDLSECLAIQLEDLGMEGELAWRIVKDHLHLVEHHKYQEIASQTGATFEEVLTAVECIRQLIPKPGQKYNPERATYVQPEVTIAKIDGDYVIIQNDDGMPQLRLNSAYKALLKSNVETGETKSFLREKFRSAIDLLRSINQRKQTIYKVCACIVSRQREFLERGPSALRPMLIKDVASELGVHSSTISRVVNNKYVDTPQGVIELRKFFSIGIENPDGDEMSIVQVKLKIREIIADEKHEKPYSDNQIGQILRRDNILITRRTVAKYREQMQIAGSRGRRIGYMLKNAAHS